jgi:hypothetical protein
VAELFQNLVEDVTRNHATQVPGRGANEGF